MAIKNCYVKELKYITMKTINFKKIFFLPLLLVMFITSCQDEVTEITNPNEEDTIEANSSLANLMRNTAANDGSIDNIIDLANCLEIQLPVTVIVDGIEIIVSSQSDYDLIEDLFDASGNTTNDLDIVFPITIIFSDYTELVLQNQEALDTLIDSCNGENEEDDDIECVDFQYPIVFSVYNTDFQVIDTVTINDDEALYLFIENLEGGILASLNFPVTMVLANGNTLVVENNAELETVIVENQDDCDEDDDYDWNDDDFEDCDVNLAGLEEYLLACDIEAYTYDASGNILDENYLNFNAAGEVIVNGEPAVVEVGSWLLLETDSGYELHIQGLLTFSILNGDWLLLGCDEDEYIFQQETGNDTVIMELEQECEDCNNPEVLINDLVIYMPFAEEAHDLISGFSAENITNTFVEDRAGNSSCAIAFTGNDTFEIPVNTNSELIQGDSFSISVWFKMQNDIPGNLETFFRSPGNATQGFQLGVYDLNTPLFNDNSSFYLWDNDWNGEVDVQWDNTDWHHVVITVDASNTVRMYRDGVQRNMEENSSLNIGSLASDGYIIGEGFIGYLDDLRVYKKALSTNEVGALFNLESDCYTCL